MIVMAPWCNRIGGGGFHHRGRFHPISPNVPGFSMPLHGNAFQSQWQVTGQTHNQLQLDLISSGPGNFSYHATLMYELARGELTVELGVTNTGTEAMPFGIGFHPWFQTNKQTRLAFHATRELLNDDAGLPTQVGPAVDDFSTPCRLPDGRIDNTFLDWTGTASLQHSGGTIEMRSTASMLHVFSPCATAGFCCLEPQTAIPNAANFGGNPAPILEAGELATITMAISRKQQS